mmetsp:Transcript_13699/g.29407  ORF Transcript_13699/g.29407 Transcript_13699/m.29407 type:complete len:458 (-) Transcript_13699:231-1604(-)
MYHNEPDEPINEADQDDNEEELQRQEEAYQRQYENEHTWEQLQEDEHGMLCVDRIAEQRARRKRLLSAAQTARIRKGMIRYMLLVIDLSRGASAQDFRPNRLSCMIRVIRTYIRDFFDQNPLSQLGIMLMKDGVADRLTDLSGSPEAQIKKLGEGNLGASGDASLQNALDLGLNMLKSVPPYGHREMLMLFAGLSTCDPGNIGTSIKACKEARIRVSVVGVAAEVYVCKRITDETGGTYGVALHEAHLEELMLSHAPPPPATSAHALAELVCMGFPQRTAEDQAGAVYVGAEVKLAAGCYTCPRCKTKVPELPCECHVCGLTLISSPHLARSYHHLFPVPPFEEVQPAMLRSAVMGQAGAQGPRGPVGSEVSEDCQGLGCFGCMRDLSAALHQTDDGSGPQGKGAAGGAAATAPMVLTCRNCRMIFCFECDSYIHESLHNCPGCEILGMGASSNTSV